MIASARAVLALLGVFGMLALLLAARRAFDRRRWPALGHGLLAALLIGIVALGWPIVQHLISYQTMHRETPVADLVFEQTAARGFRATLTRLPDGRMQVFELTGDAWQLDARTLGWRGWAQSVGLRPLLRLEQLGARESGNKVQPAPPDTMHTLDTARGRDLWQLARDSGRFTRILDAGDASTGYVPMADGASWRVTLSAQGLLARPQNAAADSALAAAD